MVHMVHAVARLDVMDVASPSRTGQSDFDGVTSHMYEARTETPEGRQADAAAPGQAGDAMSTGKHRGHAAPEDTQSTAHGRHRRPSPSAS
jgi:hypothetical protein